jgi:hypothetical protein
MNPGNPPVDLDSAPASAKGGFLIWLSGADRDILAQCPREHGKFVGVGGAVLTTATLAWVSSAFALVVGVRVSPWLAVPIGLLWGLAIMNLDRWLVTATPRRETWGKNLVMVLPRFMLALIIGGVISTPLVLWIFQSEINAELNVLHEQKASAFETSLDTDDRYKVIPGLQQDVDRLQSIVDGTTSGVANEDPNITALRKRLADLDAAYQKAQHDATCEHDGTCGTGVPGAGSDYYIKQKYADGLKAERDQANAQLQAALAQQSAAQQQAEKNARASAAATLATERSNLNSLVASRKADEAAFAARNSQDTGLLARLEALSALTSNNGTLQVAYGALLLFITAIEVLPVLVKFLMTLGPPSLYDQILTDSDQSNIARARMRFDAQRDATQIEFEAIAERRKVVAPGIADRIVQTETEIRQRRLNEERLRTLGGRSRGDDRHSGDGYLPWPNPEPNYGESRPADPATAPDPRWSFDE